MVRPRRARALRVCSRDATSPRARSCRVRRRRCAFAAQTGGSPGHRVNARSPSRGGAGGCEARRWGENSCCRAESPREKVGFKNHLFPSRISKSEKIEIPSLVSWRAQRPAWCTRRAEAFVRGVLEERVTSIRVRSPRRGRARTSPSRRSSTDGRDAVGGTERRGSGCRPRLGGVRSRDERGGGVPLDVELRGGFVLHPRREPRGRRARASRHPRAPHDVGGPDAPDRRLPA